MAMGNIKNCPRCGKLYVEVGQKMCHDCYEKELEDEKVVADFVRDNKKATVREIVEATGVNEKVVIRMIKQGRFIQSGVEIAYPCESCGKPITSGKFCKECSNNLMKEFSKFQAVKGAVNPTAQNKEFHGMYTARQEDRRR